MSEIIVRSMKDTEVLAKKFAKLLRGGDVVLLSGDLGAGKTTFTRFVLKSLGIKDEVTSPTFTIMKEYSTKKMNIYHFSILMPVQFLLYNSPLKLRKNQTIKVFVKTLFV